ncbi:hypothetical protein [uncultured Pseudokineococcus sp.]|uniref:hypothetical protein n=1 Tax=uncultured Pseudokineococcus sp. TaxID=1642928 RepID=UPI00260547FB|nr:hypothetical protein [uncultured Pseudokineococcus sp.]
MSAASAARAVSATGAARPARPLGPPRSRSARAASPLARSAGARPGSRPAPRPPAGAAAATARAAAPARPLPGRQGAGREGAGREAAAPRVRLVAPPASSRRRLPFGALCAVVVLASLLAVLLLNISLSHGAYELHDVQARQQQAGERRQALTEEVQRSAAPEELGRRAADLGMVPSGTTGFVRLPEGVVVGAPAPALAPPAGEGGAAAPGTAAAPPAPADVGVEDLAADEPPPAEAAVEGDRTARDRAEDGAPAADSTAADSTADDSTAEESAP